MELHTREDVLLKVSPIKEVMRFGKKGKLSPVYIGPFEILECVEPVGIGSLIYQVFIWYSIYPC